MGDMILPSIINGIWTILHNSFAKYLRFITFVSEIDSSRLMGCCYGFGHYIVVWIQIMHAQIIYDSMQHASAMQTFLPLETLGKFLEYHGRE